MMGRTSFPPCDGLLFKINLQSGALFRLSLGKKKTPDRRLVQDKRQLMTSLPDVLFLVFTQTGKYNIERKKALLEHN